MKKSREKNNNRYGSHDIIQFILVPCTCYNVSDITFIIVEVFQFLLYIPDGVQQYGFFTCRATHIAIYVCIAKEKLEKTRIYLSENTSTTGTIYLCILYIFIYLPGKHVGPSFTIVKSL